MEFNLDDVDDEVLFGERDDEIVPPSLRTTAPTMDIAFHPALPLLAVGLVTGEVELYQYAGKEMVKKHLENDFSSWLFKNGKKGIYNDSNVVMHHNHGNMQMHPFGGVTSMEFTDDGSYLVTSSSDKTISVLDCISSRLVIHLSSDAVASKTSKKKKLNAMNKKNDGVSITKKKKEFLVTPNPHKHGISALNVCDENLIATGDDDGMVAIWDMRSRQPAFVYHEHGDYVSQLLYFTDVSELVSSSGDTCLGVFDTKAGKIRDFSEKRKDELTCFAFINSSGASSTFIPSIFCGTTDGSLPIWKYGSWRRPYDVMEGHPHECEAMISFHGEETTFNHNIVLTGACDGIVRVLQMYPLRRQLCHLSARDAIQGSSFSTAASSQQKREHVAIRRERGSEAIQHMRVSHDSQLLAVSGTDHIVDFVDVRFLSDEKALDALRYKREQRHISTIREMEIENEAKAAKEQRMMDGIPSSDDSDDENSSSVSSVSSDDSDNENDEDDVDSDDESVTRHPTKRLKGEHIIKEKSSKIGSKTVKRKSSVDGKEGKEKTKGIKEKGKETDVDWMEEYQLDRAKKRERGAAARWLKEEKKRKVNFTYEKRRRRVGGFFADILSHD